MSLEQALKGEYSFHKDPEAALKNYHEYGFHLERNHGDNDFCDFMIQQANSLSRAREGDFKPALMPHKENTVFFDAMKKPETVAILRQLVGGTVAGMQTQVFYCKPGTRGFSLHQDNFYVQARPGVFVSVWTALVDTHEKNGGLVIYPGSHKEGDLPVRKLSLELDPKQDKNANNEETVVPEKYMRYQLTIPKGSALFIHAHLVHGSNSNQSDHSRYSLLNLYIKDGEDFRSGNSARREAFALT